MEKLFLFYMLADLLIGIQFLRKDRAYFLPLIALAGLASSAYQGYQSAKQRAKASQLRPSNYVPPGVQEAEANARQDAMATTSPGYNRGLQQIGRSTSNYIDAAKRIGGSSVQVQQGAADADAREKELVKNLAINNEQFRVQRRQDLNRLLMQKGEYQQQNMNNYNSAVSALKGASDQNAFNAVSGAAEGLIYSAPDSMISPNQTAADGTAPPVSSRGSYMGNPTFRGYSPRAGTRFSMFQQKNMNLSPYEIALLRQQGLYNR